jgi:acetyltransferase-like isoleucine patch superfamily enzyme
MRTNFHIDDDVDLSTGDCVYFGDNVSIVGRGKLTIGDYTKIHRNTLIVCLSDVTLGHNCWIGERSILDGTGGLTIGNNVGVGFNTSIFTHAAFGDTFSGCNLRYSKHVTIADEAWLVGHSILQTSDIASRVVVMPMSNVTADITVPNTVWAGNPVVDQTNKYGVPWHDVTVAQKTKHFDMLLRLYERDTQRDWHSVFVSVDRLPHHKYLRDPAVTLFEMDRRIYTKRSTQHERDFMQWLLRHNKAKFTPEERRHEITD